MTNFSLDEHSVLPSTLSPSQNWQVAAPYFSKSKHRFLRKRNVVGAPPIFYPATIVEVAKDRQSALIRYHEEPNDSTRSIPAEHIVFPPTAVPHAQRCNQWDRILWDGPPGTFRVCSSANGTSSSAQTTSLPTYFRAERELEQVNQMIEKLEHSDGLETPPLPEPSTERTVTGKAPQPAPALLGDAHEAVSLQQALEATAPQPVFRRFEMPGKNGMKFWHISREGHHTTTHYGALPRCRNGKPRSSHRAHDSPEAAIEFFDDVVASKVAKGYTEVVSATFEPEKVQTEVFVAKWAQKCSCGCGTSISPGDEIVKHVGFQSYPTATLFGEEASSPVPSSSSWAVREHIEEPWSYRPAGQTA